MQPAPPPPAAVSGATSRPAWARGLLVGMLGAAFLLRVAGVSYGLPAWVWLPEHFLRGRFLATFRVRGTREGAQPIARLEIVRHLPGRGYDVVAARDWTPGLGAGAWEEVVLPFATDVEPVDVELRVHYYGRGRLDIDGMTVVPDVRAALVERLAALGPVGLPVAPAAPR